MFYSQQFLAKKGPLGSIWVAAYCLKRLHRDQITQTDIPSSVDKILIDEWPSVTYRILGYLLLGVVRIYSKKVEFVLNDCHQTINELNKYVGRKKAVSFRDIVHAREFSVTLPERYELDAFVLELADDVDKAHIARKEDISIQECLRNDRILKRSISKRHGNVTIQGTATPTASKTSAAASKLKTRSSGLNSPESPEDICMILDMGASSSRLRSCVEDSIEEFRDIRFSREECLDFEMFYQNDTEHFGIHESSNIIQSVNVEDSDLTSVMQTEKDAHFVSEVEDETPTVERNRDLEMPADNHDLADGAEREANFTVQASPDLNMPSSKDDHITVTVERNPDLEMPSNNHDHADGAEKEANFTVQASPDLNMPSSNDKYFDVEDEVNFTDKSLDPEIALDDYITASAGSKVTILESKSTAQSETCAPVSSGKEKLRLNVQTTPDLKIPDAKDPSSTGLLAVRTPANTERRVWKANKRKCIIDDITVLTNQTLKQNINDASDLLRKRRRVRHTSLAIWRQSCTYELPQRFMEPSIFFAWTVMDPKDIQRKSNKVDVAETIEAPDIPVLAVSPPRIVTDGPTIAPGTPVRCSASTKAFLSPTAADSDGEGPFLSFQTPRKESPCQSFENARRDFAADNEEEIVLDSMDKDMGQESQDGDSQELDGWSTRTRTVAKWLHQVIASKPKCNEAGTANLSQILGGKTRKGSARVFYEILVLGSGEYVNVLQEKPYDNILLQETSKLEGKLA